MRSINLDQITPSHGFTEPGVFPRKTVYGSDVDRAPGLIPFGDAYPDKLIDPKDYKEIIQDCHERQIFPVYHQQASWAPEGFRWNQDGLNYCWAWGLAGAMMTTRALEAKDERMLSPVSIGWTVGWRNAGNYLEDAVRAARERGFCRMEFTPDPHSRSPNSFRDGWKEDAFDNRLGETWDTPNESIAQRIQYMISILATGTPIYNAYMWWRHAVSVVGVIWDETQDYNLRVVVRNSHNEDELLELTGRRAIPDEQIGICSTLT